MATNVQSTGLMPRRRVMLGWGECQTEHMSNLLATIAAMGIAISKGQKTIFAMPKRLPTT